MESDGSPGSVGVSVSPVPWPRLVLLSIPEAGVPKSAPLLALWSVPPLGPLSVRHVLCGSAFTCV